MKILSGYIILLFIASGCERFVVIGPPKNQLISEAIFNNDDHAIAAMTGIYSRMVTNGNFSYNIPFRTGLASDELTNYSTNSGAVQLYENNLQATDAHTNDFWSNGYNFIYQANAILEGCRKSDKLDSQVKDQLQGEAMFIRAFWYFYLVNFYNEVPLLLTTDYKTNALAKRTSVPEVYQQIISDLQEAVRMLNAGYVDISSKNTYGERVRPNKASAQALMARVYLYMSNWENAEKMATSVIDQTDLYDTVSIDEVFLKNNKEAIWQLPPVGSSSSSTKEAQYFVLTSKPLSGAALNNCSGLSPHILQVFEDGDLRMDHWIGSFTDLVQMPYVTYYFPFKYKITSASVPLEYSTVLRLAEQYLIRAEARARSQNVEGALADLNLVRKRAGLSSISPDGVTELLKALMHERQVELFAEWGHRWLDLKRTRTIDEVMQYVAPKKNGGTWNSLKQWWPIPQKEIESNPNLEQNPSYE